MKLWQALAQDPQTADILLTAAGVEQFLLSFPTEQRDVVWRAAASALDHEVADDTSSEEATNLFASAVGVALTERGMGVLAPQSVIQRPRPS